jgi:hypothetical protein
MGMMLPSIDIEDQYGDLTRVQSELVNNPFQFSECLEQDQSGTFITTNWIRTSLFMVPSAAVDSLVIPIRP